MVNTTSTGITALIALAQRIVFSCVKYSRKKEIYPSHKIPFYSQLCKIVFLFEGMSFYLFFLFLKRHKTVFRSFHFILAVRFFPSNLFASIPAFFF